MADNESSELVFDEEWETDAERRLDTVEYDTELGKKLGRDAQRVAAGELTPGEFYERYHEDVVDEFGIDDRGHISPSEDSDGHGDWLEGSSGGDDPGNSGDGRLPGVPGDDATRRSVLKTAGAVGAVALGGSAAQGTLQDSDESDADASDEEGVQWGMAINTNRCIACLNCVEACNEENGNTPDALWMFVHRYVEDDYTDDEEYLPRPCQHCSNAPCEAACPVASRHTRDEDGIVLTDYESCIGCRYCEVACPYGVNYLQWATPREREQFEHSGTLVDDLEVAEPEDEEPEEEEPEDIELGTDDNDGIELGTDQENNITLGSDEEDNITLGSDEDDGIELETGNQVIYDTETKDGVEGAGPPPKGVMGKCTFCVHRQDSEHEALHGTTACEDVCPTDAILFGDMNDPESDPRQHLSNVESSESTFRLLEERGAEPNIVYVGNEPSADAEPVEGPRTVEDMNRDLQRHRTDRSPITYDSEEEA